MHNARISFEAEMIVKSLVPEYKGQIKATSKVYGVKAKYCVFTKPLEGSQCVFVCLDSPNIYFWVNGVKTYYKLSESMDSNQLQKHLL